MLGKPEYGRTMTTNDLISYIKGDDLSGVRTIRPEALQLRSEFESMVIETLLQRGLTYPLQV